MARGCQYCDQAVQADWTTELKQTVHIDVVLISHSKGIKDKTSFRAERDGKREEIIKKVSALRNSGGGVLFIHIQGLDRKNRNLHYFNELVDSRLERLVGDGSLFVDNYQKLWPVDADEDETASFEKAYEFLLLTVKGSPVVSTYDFKTKVATDESINAPSSQNLYQLIFGCKQSKQEHPKIQGPSFSGIEESRSLQVKAFKGNEFVDNISDTNLNSLVEFIWTNLRLREYITSIATVQGGGSYFLGIEEVIRQDLNYRCITSVPVGINIKPQLLEPLKTVLLAKINSNILIQPNVHDQNFVDIDFHIVIPFVQHFVLEVAVSHVNGCVFYDKQGPEAFFVNKTELQRIPFVKWLDKLQKYNSTKITKLN